jgi:hypothetical protein
MKRWIYSGTWKAYLKNSELEQLSIDEQVAFVVEHLDDIVNAFSTPSIEHVLVELGAKYMRGILGIQLFALVGNSENWSSRSLRDRCEADCHR